MNGLKKLIVCLVFALGGPGIALAGPVDVNTADAETISAELQGIGMTKAQAIVDYRTAHGPFKSQADLLEVKGIGVRTLEINKDNILLKPAGKAVSK